MPNPVAIMHVHVYMHVCASITHAPSQLTQPVEANGGRGGGGGLGGGAEGGGNGEGLGGLVEVLPPDGRVGIVDLVLQEAQEPGREAGFKVRGHPTM